MKCKTIKALNLDACVWVHSSALTFDHPDTRGCAAPSHRRIRHVTAWTDPQAPRYRIALTQAVPLKEIRLRVSTFADDMMLLKDLLTSGLAN